MKVIIIGRFPKNTNKLTGGVESAVYGSSKALKKENIEVEVISFNENEDKQREYFADNILVHSFPINYRLESFRWLKDTIKVNEIVRKSNADIIHMHETTFVHSLRVLFNKKPKILNVHGLIKVEIEFRQSNTLKRKYRLWRENKIENFILKHSKNIIVDTEYVKKSILPYTNANVYVIPIGIDDSFFSIQDKPIKNKLISVGVINQRKGYLGILKAIKIVKEKFNDISYEIIGNVNDKEYYFQLTKFINENNLQENVKIFNNLSNEEVKEKLSKANIFILNSQEESQGIAICEAMACGKPIIASNRGGIPNVVSEKEGFLFGYDDFENIAKTIINLIENENLRNELSKNAKEKAKNYSWQKISKEILKVYKEVLNS